MTSDPCKICRRCNGSMRVQVPRQKASLRALRAAERVSYYYQRYFKCVECHWKYFAEDDKVRVSAMERLL